MPKSERRVSTKVEILQRYQTLHKYWSTSLSTKVEILQRYQTLHKYWQTSHLQKQKFYRGIRLRFQLRLLLIYKSRNFIEVLDTDSENASSLSTKVEILQRYQTSRNIGGALLSTKVEILQRYQTRMRGNIFPDLQKQKFYRGIRLRLRSCAFLIYKSRNFIEVLDSLVPDGDHYLQKQKFYRGIRPGDNRIRP